MIKDLISAVFVIILFISVLLVSMSSTRLIFGFNKDHKDIITDIKTVVLFLVLMVVSGSIYLYITET